MSLSALLGGIPKTVYAVVKKTGQTAYLGNNEKRAHAVACSLDGSTYIELDPDKKTCHQTRYSITLDGRRVEFNMLGEEDFSRNIGLKVLKELEEGKRNFRRNADYGLVTRQG